MAVAYLIGPIKCHQVDKTYKLIEAVGYHVNLQVWRDFCEAAFARNWPSPYVEEVITAENPLGYIAGVCIMRRTHDKIYGNVLGVPVFIVASAADSRGVSRSLLNYLLAIARNRHCGFIRVAALQPTNWPGSTDICGRNGGGILIPVQ
ncbi:hypothetical protein ILFOPFJJ_05721 [Ensifer psoraleae]|uniref:hypothetical protein n=1 Tax=Sinorhizobium psoraleae TaxID=520838 RepID=UPI00156A30CD|nr:hypothetical protein [Sinorhizobium psoraleae]NRP74799.1 hypothetical protein [Sinorhizobium psoraleae]